MTLVKNSNNRTSLRIFWVSSIILDSDIHIHKTSQIEVLRHLAKRGHDVYLIAMRSKKRYYLKNSNIHIISIPLRHVPLISSMLYGLVLFFLPFYIIRKRPNCIVTDPLVPVFSFLWKPLLSRFMRLKVILDIRSTPVSTFGMQRFLENFQFNISVNFAKTMFDGITIITPMMKNEVCTKFNIDPKSVGIWSSAASTELFAYEKNFHYGFELRKKFGLSNKFIVFYHGSLTKTRGITESIEAMMIVKKKYPNVVLFLLGGGSNIHFLENVIQKCGVENRVILHGIVDYEDVPKYIAMSDVGIVPLPNHPYWRFQCPLKLLEYLAMNKVVIVTDIPAHRLVIGNENCGIYIASTTPAEIARSIMYAYRNKEKLGEWGAIGRTIIDRKYSWEKVARDLENYLLSIDDKVALGTKYGNNNCQHTY